MTQNREYKRFKEEFDSFLLNHKDRIVIVSHKGPDPDSICSTASIYYYLKEVLHHSSNILIVYEGTSSSFLQEPLSEMPFEFTEDLNTVVKSKDLIICVDTNELSRVTDNYLYLEKVSCKWVFIDHHKAGTKSNPAHLSLIDQNRVSCCELIYDTFYKKLDVKSVDRFIIKLIFAGILADSGFLSFIDKGRISVLQTVTDIVTKYNISAHEVKTAFFGFESSTYKPLSKLLGSYKVVKNKVWGDFGHVFISEERYPENSRHLAWRHFASTYLSNTKGTLWGVGFSYDGNSYGVSFRSSPGGPDVSRIAEYFGGGGHKTACGFDFDPKLYPDMTLKMAERIVYDYLKSHKPNFIE